MTATLEAPARDPDRCERLVHKGTGVRPCNGLLDEHGNCPEAGHHIEEYQCH